MVASLESSLVRIYKQRQNKDDKIEIIITEEILDNCDVALYLMEHNDIGGKFIINKNGIFVFEGCTYISGKEVKLELEVNLTL